MQLTFRRLDAEEKEQLFPKRGQVDVSAFVDMLDEVTVGDAVAIQLDGLTERAMKRRIGQAAKQQGLRLRYKSAGEGIVFVVLPEKQPRAAKTEENGTQPARRSRRAAATT